MLVDGSVIAFPVPNPIVPTKFFACLRVSCGDKVRFAIDVHNCAVDSGTANRLAVTPVVQPVPPLMGFKILPAALSRIIRVNMVLPLRPNAAYDVRHVPFARISHLQLLAAQLHTCWCEWETFFQRNLCPNTIALPCRVKHLNIRRCGFGPSGWRIEPFPGKGPQQLAVLSPFPLPSPPPASQ